MLLFGFFSLVLVMVYWINRAVVLFDQLIANGQSAVVFLEFTALSLPNIIRLVLPMAAFAASVYVANRLASESELVIVQATGFGPFRVLKPVLTYGLIVGLIVAFLANFLVPASLSQLSVRTSEISDNLTARLLQEGTIIHPTKGVTFYIREISAEGELLDVFLFDGRSAKAHTTYNAKSALLVREDDGPKLIMFNGIAQNLDLETNQLSLIEFSDFVFNVASFSPTTNASRRNLRHLTTPELLNPTAEVLEETRTSRAVLLQEGHSRIAQSLLTVVAAIVGFSALLIGNYSRFGLWRQIAFAVFLIIVIKFTDNVFLDIARANEKLWVLAYASTALGVLIILGTIWLAARPALFTRRGRAFAL